MKRSYLDYAMSVIISRALPDVRDGLKPVHRRILFAMKESGYDYDKPFRKAARIVGEVMGKYHPHGDTAIYDAMVRMAQSFSMRLPLVEGQGNFGSVDGDSPAAMRYTEARLTRAAHVLLSDVDLDTVDFQPNYDEAIMEPKVLPARFPNLLVNGTGGIAVGMATNIPPHNLGEVIDACCAYIDDPSVPEEILAERVHGPDFPTGGIILGYTGIRTAYTTGRGLVIVRGRCHIEEIRKGREAIVVTEIPYQVNKARMIEVIADLVREKRIEGIAELRDESDRQGLRIVIEIKRDVQAEVVLNQLHKFTPLQTSFGVNILALNEGRPETMTLKTVISAFITFREEVIRRRTTFQLRKAQDKVHALIGLAIAITNLDEMIPLIRISPNQQVAYEWLTNHAWIARDLEPLMQLAADEVNYSAVDNRYRLTETQARAILDLRLHRLTGLEREKLYADLRNILSQIEEYSRILSSRQYLYTILRQELIQVKQEFSTKRRTSLEENISEHDIEDLIQREDMVVTVTNTGYIKRVPLSTYRAQRRGGKGRTGMVTNETDFVSRVFVANTHTPVLFFSSSGIAYQLTVYKLPEGTPQSRGKAMVNILPLKDGESISAVMPLSEDKRTWHNLHVMFATSSGHVRRNFLSDFTNIMTNGKIAMKLDVGDSLIGVLTCNETNDIFLASSHGKCIRFPVTDVRIFAGRTSTGVRGIRLANGDNVISMSVLWHDESPQEQRRAYLKLRRSGEELHGEEWSIGQRETLLSSEEYKRMIVSEEFILTVTNRGLGKKTSSYEYRVTGRGGQGITNIEMTGRNGQTVAAFSIRENDQIVMVTDSGQIIRLAVNDIRTARRATQGVTLFRTGKKQKVVSAVRLPDVNEEDIGQDESNSHEHITHLAGNSEN